MRRGGPGGRLDPVGVLARDVERVLEAAQGLDVDGQLVEPCEGG